MAWKVSLNLQIRRRLCFESDPIAVVSRFCMAFQLQTLIAIVKHENQRYWPDLCCFKRVIGRGAAALRPHLLGLVERADAEQQEADNQCD